MNPKIMDAGESFIMAGTSPVKKLLISKITVIVEI